MSDTANKIGIVVIGYNRVDCISRLLNRLNDCDYPTDDVPLVISLDNCGKDDVLNFATEFEWQHGKKTVVHQPQRLGLRKHILRCGEYMDDYGWDAQIVLEDDVYTSVAFYGYAMQTVAKYKDDENIAGISLYTIPQNQTVQLPFAPADSKYDVFFMQLAQSWGQIWMRDSWHKFREWYEKNGAPFTECAGVPHNICRWPESSWLKYHMRYCIEEGKYFVYPHVSLTTCFSAAGEHTGSKSNILQTSLQTVAREYALPQIDEGLKYDAWCENEGLADVLGIEKEDICIDIFGAKKNYAKCRYHLTTLKLPYEVLKSFSLELAPMDMNVLCGLEGDDIYLYDTAKEAPPPPEKDMDLVFWGHYNRFIYPEPMIKKLAQPIYARIRKSRAELLLHPKKLSKKVISKLK